MAAPNQKQIDMGIVDSVIRIIIEFAFAVYRYLITTAF